MRYSRFVGPATTVQVHCSAGPRLEVRTEGQAIAELGHRVASLVLTQEQWNLLHTNSPRVCISGFYGTGVCVCRRPARVCVFVYVWVQSSYR
jgi:hypothetical protein